MSQRLDLRYLNCRVALDFLSHHGRPPRNAAVQWERIFNALHRTHTMKSIRAIDGLLSEYATEAALRQELERLRRAIDEPQTAYVDVVFSPPRAADVTPVSPSAASASPTTSTDREAGE